ncbi:hypothetical protein ACIQ9J_21920 [Streptomyces sp. NPDC094153]|uniref:hypothetical protein n=1 Tax=Streptomyces sp. NPDC094153 TaxID=3366058 RepID=UPI003800432D
MTAPIPRPPGVWHALARDGHLNPEERAVRDAVAAAHTPADPPADTPAQPAAVPDAAAPRKRLAPYQSLMDRTGWTASLTRTADRARLEAFQPDGAAVILTAVRGQDVNAYVLPATQKAVPRWRAIHPADLTAFLTRRQVIDPHLPPGLCACGKRRYPTEARAKAAIVDVTIHRVVRQHGLQYERRAYRCPDEDLVWHLTSIPKWCDDKKPKHRTETAR